MGKFNNGILGGFNGKVGNVVGSTWKGITYMRAIQSGGNKKATEKQIIQRAKFSFATKVLQPLYPVIQAGFKSQENKQSAQNAAVANFLRYSIDGDYPAFTINYENLLLAKGSLQVANEASVNIVEGKISFNWKDSANSLKINSGQQAILVGIVDGFYPSYSINEYNREDQSGAIPFPTAPSGGLVHCYLSFTEKDGLKRACNSTYLGTVSVP